MEEWNNFFEETSEPLNFKKISSDLEKFCLLHKNQTRPLVLVTSGGTTVPLEVNTVRFVDNFSAGTRGAASAENFLKAGYAVVFLNREKSVQPFYRHLDPQYIFQCVTQALDGSLQINDDKIKRIYSELQYVEQTRTIFKIPFVSLAEYLWYLKAITQIFNALSPKSLLYLAAAVSDFYIPKSKMTEHKIQSSTGPLNVTLQLVPKMLSPLVSLWGPDLFVVSFKLETDLTMLQVKSEGALQRYKHKLVIGNLMQTRRTEVTFVSANHTESLKLTSEQIREKVEIEKLIVEKVCQRYQKYLNGTDSLG